MRSIILTLSLLGCVSDSTVDKISNKLPTISIGSHQDDSLFQEGVTTQFRAQASDDDDPSDTLEVIWYVDELVVCEAGFAEADGSSFCDITFGPEAERVVVEVRDPKDGGGSDEISVQISPTDAPRVEILSPAGGATFYSDSLIEFSGEISDTEDTPDLLISKWASSLDGELSLDTTVDSGGFLSDFVYLSQGEHAIELEVTDTTGKVTTDSVVIDVRGPNESPLCAITTPLDGDSVTEGATVVFSAQVSDPDIDPNELSVTWTSDKDGLFGESTPDSSGLVTFASSVLSIDTHTILMDVEDEAGARCTASILFTVGTPPTLVVESPSNNDIYEAGESISFRATVTDAEDPAALLTVLWSSDMDAVLSNSSPSSQGVSQFAMDTLSTGIHILTVQVTDSDGLTSDEILSLHVDSPPTAPTISISPNPAYSSDDLNATVGGSTDSDGDPITYSYQWYQNGSATTHTTTQVPASDTLTSDTWTIRATPNDGFLDGPYTEASVSIMSSNPVVSSAAVIVPSPAYTTDTLNCSATFTDLEDGPLSATYAWIIGGIPQGSLSSLLITSSNSNVGDIIECVATAMDSDGLSVDSTASLILENTSPTISSVVISPNTNVDNASTLSCSGTAADIDDDPLSETIEWTNANVVLGSGSPFTLNSSIAQFGDTITCTITVEDIHGEVASAQSTVLLSNSLPTAPTVSISPTPATTSDTLTCTATGSVDPDGNTVSYSYIWYKNGVQTSYVTSTVLSGATVGGDVWTVRVTPNDGNDDGPYTEASVNISNSLPTISQVSISPSSVATLDTLTANATLSDLDNGQSLSATYSWHVVDASNNNTDSVVQNGSLNSLSGSLYFDRGDQVYVTATPYDGLDYGAPLSSNTVTVSNTPPSAPTVGLSPTSPYEGIDPLICSVNSQGTDVDGDGVQYLYEWYDENMNLVQTTGPTFALSDVVSSAITTTGTWICDVTAYDGTDYGGTGTASVEVNGGSCNLTWDPNNISSGISLLNNNFSVMSNSSWEAARSNSPRSTGKHYFEVEVLSDSNNFYMVGVGPASFDLNTNCCLGSAGSFGYYIYNGGSSGELRPSQYGAALCNNGAPSCTIGVAVDLDAGHIWWSMDGVWQLSNGPGSPPTHNTLSGTYYPMITLALNYYNNTHATLYACPAEQLYGPPAGFQGWE